MEGILNKRSNRSRTGANTRNVTFTVPSTIDHALEVYCAIVGVQKHEVAAIALDRFLKAERHRLLRMLQAATWSNAVQEAPRKRVTVMIPDRIERMMQASDFGHLRNQLAVSALGAYLKEHWKETHQILHQFNALARNGPLFGYPLQRKQLCG